MGAAALVLAASGVDAAKRGFSDIAKTLNTKSAKSSKGSFSKSGTTRVSASVKCTASGWAEQYEDHMDSYIKAGV